MGILHIVVNTEYLAELLKTRKSRARFISSTICE